PVRGGWRRVRKGSKLTPITRYEKASLRVQGAAQETPSTMRAAYEDPPRVFTRIVTQVPAIRSQAAQHPDIGSTAALLTSLEPDQFARIDDQCLGQLFQYRDGGRNFGAFDGAQIAGAQPGAIGQFLLRHFASMACATHIGRHDPGQVHAR